MVLRSIAAEDNIFPLRVPFGRPSTSDDFVVVRSKIEALAKASHPWRVTWEIVETRRWGQQRWPVAVEFDTVEDLASAIGRKKELSDVRDALRDARATCPALEPWLLRNAHRISEYLDSWHGLVAVCAYLSANRRPKCYARQIPVPTDTKFIERHERILRELLDVTLGDDVDASGMSFADRFGLLLEPAQIRFRFLDADLRRRVGWPVSESTVPVPQLRELTWTIPRAVVVENRDVFLCLPTLRDTLAIWGAGKAVPLLAQLPWLHGADIVYWGDLDEAGFGLLSSLRGSFPQVRSALMDFESWERWKHLALPGRRDRGARCANLTPSEREALNAVVAGPWLLEQERIPPNWAQQSLAAALSS